MTFTFIGLGRFCLVCGGYSSRPGEVHSACFTIQSRATEANRPLCNNWGYGVGSICCSQQIRAGNRRGSCVADCSFTPRPIPVEGRLVA